MDAPLLPEILLRHGRFVQSLARGLLRDAQQAEDVAQDTWARYLERGPRAPGVVRSWLRTVTRNLAFNALRQERGRALRDERAARPEALPSASEELAHGECLRRVIEAVLALDEPYRATILGRYYEGRDLRRIAEETHTPLATVRSREQRALEQLRARLDRELGGERAGWALLLARIAGPAAKTAGSTGALASGGLVKAAWLAVGVAAIGLVWSAVRNGDESVALEPEVVRSAPSEEAQPVSTPLSTPQSSPAAAETRVAAVASPSLARPGNAPGHGSRAGSSGASSALQAGLAEIRGRFVLPGGAPAAGASVGMHGWGANEGRELQYAVPESWQDPGTTTDADGRFALRFDPPRAFQFALDATLAGHAKASWRWNQILPGATKDLGEVELPVGAIVEGRIVDRAGNELPGDWYVYADALGVERGDGRDRTRVRSSVEPGTGRFRLADVCPGPNELKAYSSMTTWVRGTRVTAVAGEVVSADIVYSGPDNSRRITVTTTSQPFHVMGDPPEGALRLSGPGIAPRPARLVEGSASTFSFENLPPAAYAVELDDPRYLPWRQDGVQPGTAVSTRLEGSSALALDVRGPDGAALERYEVRVAFRNVSFFPREFRVHDGSAPLAGGRVRGMFAGDYTVTVLAEGFGSRSAEVDGLAPGETRAVSIGLGTETTLALGGRVVHSDGSPVAGAEVLLLAPAQEDDSPASPVLRVSSMTSDPESWRRELAATSSDASGQFRFELTRPGGYALLSTVGTLSSASAALAVPAGASLEGVELVLPRGGSLQGRMLAPPGVSCAGLRAWACPAGESSPHAPHDLLLQTASDLGRDGSYALGPLAPGAVRVFLLLPESATDSLARSNERLSGALEVGTAEVLDGLGIQADFALGEHFPGSVVLSVLVNGAPASGIDVTLRAVDAEDPTELVTVTRADGSSEPLPAFPGLYRAYLQDPVQGWGDWYAEQVRVSSAASTQQTLVIASARGTLTCTRNDGQALANEPVTVLRASEWAGAWHPLATRETDGAGQIELVLTPGEYALQRGHYDPRQQPVTVPFSWTSSGPLQTTVQL